MDINVGDLVTRKSHNHDLVFEVTEILENTCMLKGKNIRLIADSPIDDLEKYHGQNDKEEKDFVDRVKPNNVLDRNDYFYLPGKILHIDADNTYLNRCLKYYEEMNIWAIGICEEESEVPKKIHEFLEEYSPNIVVITGHDAFYRKDNMNSLNSYKNSKYFVESVKQARKYESSHEKLIIIAGACQSDYEELIRAGANFASSPKRINIHALDPAIVASKISLSEITKDIDLKGILNETKYGKDGMGGIITKGTMYVGYPR